MKIRRSTIVIGAFTVLLAAGAVLGVTRASSRSTRAAPAGLRLAAASVSSSARSVKVPGMTRSNGVIVGHSYKNDVSRPLRQMPAAPSRPRAEREASANPGTGPRHESAPDGARQAQVFAPRMPAAVLNFSGIAYPGVNCACFPPDTNGEVGATQYVQMVNQGIQVFDKTSGASLLGPVDIAAIWTSFGGVCDPANADTWGDPVVVYDQLANRWVISQFAGLNTFGTITDECVAVSTSSDATGAYYRYDFHLGANFYDYPKISVWPDGYYMSMNVFNASGTAYLGPQPFAFNRAAMLTGAPATFITPGITAGDSYLPADLDGPNLPPAGAPDPFVGFPSSGSYQVFRFHVDWATPGNSTFTLAGTPAAAAFTVLCPTTANCVPQAGTARGLDGLADRLMFRAAYRNFGDHESLVGNFTVRSNSVAGIRWFELRNLTSGSPALAQESTYQPDTTWRWMGSAAMDGLGDMALGYSASSAVISPQIRYAGRLAGDPPNTLAQGEAHLYDGTGSQTDNQFYRWGDYSDMTVDPVDDCTFWYTQEYYPVNAARSWSTRIGNFKFPGCAVNTVTVTKSGAGSGLITSSPAGVSCGATCLFEFADGTSVTLNAAADPGSVFAGWSGGGCSGTGSCTVTLNADTTVTATFVLLPTLTVTKIGSSSGTVTSSPVGISCGGTCTAHFKDGTPVTLTATPNAGSKFTGWSGDCSGTGACTLTMSRSHAVTASFAKVPKCKVPKVVGLTLKKARAKLLEAHCRLGKVKKKASSPKKTGRVLSQRSKPGKVLASGAKVGVTVGKGRK